MEKTKLNKTIPTDGSMMNQKTNEDYNKTQPNPNDPNLIKTNPKVEEDKPDMQKKETDTHNAEDNIY